MAVVIFEWINVMKITIDWHIRIESFALWWPSSSPPANNRPPTCDSQVHLLLYCFLMLCTAQQHHFVAQSMHNDSMPFLSRSHTLWWLHNEATHRNVNHSILNLSPHPHNNCLIKIFMSFVSFFFSFIAFVFSFCVFGIEQNSPPH